MVNKQPNGLVCFAFCSTPARSCSDESFHRSMALAANAINTAGNHQTLTDQEDAGVAGAQGDDDRACQMLTSPKQTLSPSDFLPMTSAMATTSTETTDRGRQKGRALSERDDLKEAKPWFGSNLPSTWAPSCTTFSERLIFPTQGSSVVMIPEYSISMRPETALLLFEWTVTVWRSHDPFLRECKSQVLCLQKKKKKRSCWRHNAWKNLKRLCFLSVLLSATTTFEGKETFENVAFDYFSQETQIRELP